MVKVLSSFVRGPLEPYITGFATVALPRRTWRVRADLVGEHALLQHLHPGQAHRGRRALHLLVRRARA